MILVTTTGKVGSEASRLLAKRGVPVRVLAHHPSKATSTFRRASTWQCKASRAWCLLVSPAIRAQELNLIESALRADGSGVAGARHVAKITSKASSDSPIARRRGQAQIETRLIASGLAYTLLRNNALLANRSRATLLRRRDTGALERARPGDQLPSDHVRGTEASDD
jgi:uncharacterized protein YbjT (DUF2867 family)